MKTLFFALSIAFLLTACGPQLRRADLDSRAVERERSEQMRLARELRHERRRRLNGIAARLAPEARKLCRELLDRRETECTYRYKVVEGESINAAADGKTVYIFTGLMRFIESDDELAVIVGHEIAHNMLDHINQKRGAAIFGAVIDGIIAGATGVNTQGAFSKVAARAYSQEYEAESDYLGVYLAERAGYDITVAPDLWRRMGIENSDAIVARYGATHPSTPERSVALSGAIHEIELKKMENLALLPNRIEEKVENADPVNQPEDSMIANVPSRKSAARTALTGGGGMGTGRFVVPNPPAVGKWQFVAEQYASDNGCNNPEGGRPLTEMTDKLRYQESYEAQCADGKSLSFNCHLGGCGL